MPLVRAIDEPCPRASVDANAVQTDNFEALSEANSLAFRRSEKDLEENPAMKSETEEILASGAVRQIDHRFPGERLAHESLDPRAA